MSRRCIEVVASIHKAIPHTSVQSHDELGVFLLLIFLGHDGNFVLLLRYWIYRLAVYIHLLAVVYPPENRGKYREMRHGNPVYINAIKKLSKRYTNQIRLLYNSYTGYKVEAKKCVTY